MLNFHGQKNKKVFALIILDGWGIAPAWGGNAITLAEVKNYNKVVKRFPFTTLLASDGAVGLPTGASGNSEAGHLNIGAGHTVYQDQPIIDKQIKNGQFFNNKTLLEAINHAKTNNSTIHLMGLLSKAGVHSQLEHVYSILQLLKASNFSKVQIHLFTDGRDSEQMSGIEMLAELEAKLKQFGLGRISTICGRFYAMDRDNRWERISRAYDLLTTGKGARFTNAGEAFTNSYARGITDEFIEPAVIASKDEPESLISDNDTIIFYNFRADRAREITEAFLVDRAMPEMPRRKILRNVYFSTFVMHGDRTLGHHVFEPEQVKNPLAQVWSENNLAQFHTAETEKYAHVTYFFNGGREEPFKGENRLMIPSPRSYPTYDKIPEMSAMELTENIIKRMQRNLFDSYVINFANPDMVGHTGNLKATVKAVEFVDSCLGRILSNIIKLDGTAFVFADHGNAEQMVNPKTGEPDTEHTTNPVPFGIVGNGLNKENLKLHGGGILGNIAPTVLDLMNLPPSKDMDQSLIVK